MISTASSVEGPAVIGPLQLETNYNSVKSIVDSTAGSEVKPDPLSLSASLRPTPLRLASASSNHSTVGRQPLQQIDVIGGKKTFDENGNALPSMDGNGKTGKKKKPRSDRKVTIINSEHVEGHRFVIDYFIC